LIDVLENRPDLRSAAIGHLTDDPEHPSPSQGEGGHPPRVRGRPSQGEGSESGNGPQDRNLQDDVVADAKDDWEAVGSKDLPITGDPDGEWDGTDALDQMFNAAEGEDGEINAEMVQRGVAAYDSSSDGQSKEDYKGPFAVVEDGEMVADLADITYVPTDAG
jgi:hypothetical protein